MTRFIVLFPGRTGSSHLIGCLGSHPAIVAEGERLVGRGDRWQRRWVEQLYDTRGDGVSAVGFKTKLKDVGDRNELAALLRRLDVRVIVLLRRNTVKLAVSVLNARRLYEATGRWNRDPDTPPLPPFALSVDDLADAIEQCRASERELTDYAASLDRPTLTLYYEDLLAEEGRVLSEVLAFLDVPPAPLSSVVVKNTDDDLRRVLLNYDELRAAFADGPCADMF